MLDYLIAEVELRNRINYNRYSYRKYSAAAGIFFRYFYPIREIQL